MSKKRGSQELIPTTNPENTIQSNPLIPRRQSLPPVIPRKSDIHFLQQIALNLPKEAPKELTEPLKIMLDSHQMRAVQEQRMKSIKLHDKLVFTLTLFAFIAFFYFLGHSPTQVFIWIYTGLVTCIFVYRILFWPALGYHLYLLEFCYFANLLSLYFLFFEPKNEKIWFMMFTSDSGVIALAAFIFKNKAAFNSVEQMLSLFLHVLPPVCCYMVRWKSHLTSVDYWGLIDVPFDKVMTMEEIGEMLLQGVTFYVFWIVIYSVIVHFLSFRKVNRGEWSSTVKDMKWLNKYGEIQQRVILQLTHLGIFVVGGLWSVVIYQSFWLSNLYLMGLYLVMFWNGACYYIDHFSMNYQKKLEEETYNEISKQFGLRAV